MTSTGSGVGTARDAGPSIGLYRGADEPLAARGIEVRCTAGLSN